MCCLCFNRVEYENLATDEERDKTDVCIPCAIEENKRGADYGLGEPT